MKTYRRLIKWHRRIGISVALLVILLVVTGISLNHTDQLKLDQKFIGSSFLLDWYNISLPSEPVSFAVKSHRISLLGNRLYYDDLGLDDRAEQLLGAVEINNTIVIAIPEAILLLDQQGELIEKLTGSDGVPAGLQRIGFSPENQLIVQTVHGEYQTDIDLLNWEQRSTTAIKWSKSSPLPASLKTSLLKAYRGEGLSVERVLLDLHSGRIFGDFGVLLIDVSALLFLILAITGIWSWSKTRK